MKENSKMTSKCEEEFVMKQRSSMKQTEFRKTRYVSVKRNKDEEPDP